MKKNLLVLSLILTCTNLYAKDNTEVIKLEKGNVYCRCSCSNLGKARNSITSSYVIDAKEIEEKRYTNLGEVLQDLSGVSTSAGFLDMRGQGGDKFQQNVRTKLIIDGVPQNYSTWNQITPIYLINVQDIEKVEVIPGAGGVLYGDGTSAGVISITTKNYKGNHGNIAYRYGSYKSHIFDVGAGTSVGDFDFNFSYEKNKTDGYSDKDKPLNEQNQYKNNTDYFLGKVNYNINKTDSIMFMYNMHKENYNRLVSNESKPVNYNRKKDEFVLKYDAKITDNNKLELLGYSNRMNTITKDETKKNEYIANKKGIKLNNNYSYGDGSNILFGLGYKKEKFNDITERNGKRSIDYPATKTTLESFVYNNYKYDNIIFTQGLRYEKLNYDAKSYYQKEYPIKNKAKNLYLTLGLNYLYSDSGNIYTKYERSYNTPMSVNLSNYEGGKFVSNNIKAEIVNYLELGWNDYLLNSLISVDVYYGNKKNEIKLDRYSYDDSGKTKRYGLDLKLEQKFDKFTFREAYSYVNTKIIKGLSKDEEGKKIPYSIPHKLTLGVNYKFNKKLDLSLNANYNSNYYISSNNKDTKKINGKERTKFGKAWMANFRVNYRPIENLDIYAGVNNIFSKNGSFIHDNNKYYIVSPERNYYTGFSYKF